VLGPLPPFYRVTVAVCTFLAFVGLGLWAALLMPETVFASIGTGLGAGLGVVAVFLVLHDHQHRHEQRQRVRVRLRSPRH
jgi:hypothetical protein